jgi:hypothetical protein
MNAGYAPVLPCDVTGALAPNTGYFSITEPDYRAFLGDVLEGWRGRRAADGHLEGIAMDAGSRLRVRVMVVDWWALATDLTKEIFGEDDGHAGWNETAYLQAADPKLGDPKRYSKELTRRGRGRILGSRIRSLPRFSLPAQSGECSSRWRSDGAIPQGCPTEMGQGEDILRLGGAGPAPVGLG